MRRSPRAAAPVASAPPPTSAPANSSKNTNSKATPWECTLSLVATAVGGGILAVPFTMYVAGFAGGCLMCLVITLFSHWSLRILCAAGDEYERRLLATGEILKMESSSAPAPAQQELLDEDEPVKITMEDLCTAFLPKSQARTWSFLVRVSLVWLLLCAASALLIIYASNICQLFRLGDVEGGVLVFSLVFIFPATCQTRLDALKLTSGLANLGTACVFLFFVVRLATGSVASDVELGPVAPTLGAFFQALPPVLTAFCCHFNVLQIRSELDRNSSASTSAPAAGGGDRDSTSTSPMDVVIRNSMLLVGGLHACFGALGYAICGQEGMRTDILLSQDLYHFKGSGAASIGVGFNASRATVFQEGAGGGSGIAGASGTAASIGMTSTPDLAVQWGIASYLSYGIRASIFCVAVSNLLRYPLLVLPLRDVLESLAGDVLGAGSGAEALRRSEMENSRAGGNNFGRGGGSQGDGFIAGAREQDDGGRMATYTSFLEAPLLDKERGQHAYATPARSSTTSIIASPEHHVLAVDEAASWKVLSTRARQSLDLFARRPPSSLEQTGGILLKTAAKAVSSSGTFLFADFAASLARSRFLQMGLLNTIVGAAAFWMKDFSVPLSILGFTAVPLVCFLIPGLIGTQLDEGGSNYNKEVRERRFRVRGGVLVVFGILAAAGIFLTTQGVFTPVVQA